MLKLVSGDQPPCRAQLIQHLGDLHHLRTSLATARAHRKTVADEVACLEGALAQADAALDAEAEGLLSGIRKGLSGFFSAAAPFSRPDAADASRSLEIARRALVKQDAEVQRLETECEAAENQLAGHVQAALREYGVATIGKQYAEAVSNVRDLAVRLEGLDRVLGRGRDGRLVGELPGFAVADHRHEAVPIVGNPAEIQAAATVWRRLAEVWASNPKADPDKYLCFAAHDPGLPDMTPYESRSALERRLIDCESVA